MEKKSRSRSRTRSSRLRHRSRSRSENHKRKKSSKKHSKSRQSHKNRRDSIDRERYQRSSRKSSSRERNRSRQRKGSREPIHDGRRDRASRKRELSRSVSPSASSIKSNEKRKKEPRKLKKREQHDEDERSYEQKSRRRERDDHYRPSDAITSKQWKDSSGSRNHDSTKSTKKSSLTSVAFNLKTIPKSKPKVNVAMDVKALEEAEEEEKKRRRERLKLWREQQQKIKELEEAAETAEPPLSEMENIESSTEQPQENRREASQENVNEQAAEEEKQGNDQAIQEEKLDKCQGSQEDAQEAKLDNGRLAQDETADDGELAQEKKQENGQAVQVEKQENGQDAQEEGQGNGEVSPSKLDEARKDIETEEKKDEDAVDPLDAYMAGIVEEAIEQESFVSSASNVISFEDLQSQPKEKEDSEMVETEGKPEGLTSAELEAREEEELREFMRAIKEKREREAELEQQSLENKDSSGRSASNKSAHDTGRIYQGLEEDTIGEEAGNIDHRSALEILQEAQKKKDIKPVDHSKIEYVPFQKKLYVTPREIKDLADDEVQELRSKLEIKVRGKNCPRPLLKWSQCGFSLRLQQLIQKHGYVEPFAIQRQALPAIMAGRDVIGIAKTGSGKTLAFLLPMFRHILHQPPLKEGEGPIGLIMAPARELAQQIYVEAKRFAKDLGLRATAVYGGSSVSEQIGNLKRGSEIVICTPGRMIDILCMSAGKVVSLQRVSYVVLDEADRMFDMGFEPQITKIIMNIRPDRQTLLFSATFPRAVETLARKVLLKPVEITVGARSTASGDITQYVEVREESDKFMRLLQLLGYWYGKGNVLVFVNTQQTCDQIFQDLMKAGYPALSLHGGKDQIDRDYTIDDFKRQVRTLMVATSVAGRGLDVKDLVLVVNYHCPNHLEDYVHRVGRTGRAGRKGTAYTFISPDEEEYAVDLVNALEHAKQTVPTELVTLAENFKEKVKRGEARYHGSGFKGKGFTFDESEKNETQRTADLQKRQYEIDQGILVEDNASGEEEEEVVNDAELGNKTTSHSTGSGHHRPGVNDTISAVKKAQQIAQILDMQYKQTQAQSSILVDGHFEEELEINEYPQQARWKVTQKEASDSVAELTGAAIIARGSYVPSGRKPNPGERKLYLAIEGPTRQSVIEAKREIQRILDETTLQVGLGGDKYSKYNL
uniref:RNA helicase n=1 Tax=Albugo laibachii Nc14 TaxID=890382 RepID=F0VZL2_9STRA|nr:Os08g0159900 putative [Albugo laibachii Nc14]|eukprot:CCA14242.1 Os08g0159900 putative [Albugo laibachii Nc14]